MSKPTRPDPLYELRPKLAKWLWLRIGERPSITLTRSQWRAVCKLVGARARKPVTGRPADTRYAQRDYAIAWDHYANGKTIAQCADEYHVSNRTVSRAVERFAMLKAFKGGKFAIKSDS